MTQDVLIGRRSLLIAASACAMSRAFADTPYPERMIRLVAPFGAGGAGSTAARLIGDQMAQSFKQTVIVDNRPGANGMIGMEAVAKAPADGYTMLYGITGIVQNAALYKKVPYDALKDFAPASLVGTSALALLVGPTSKARTLAEFVDTAKKSGASFGSFGIGSTGHIYGELLGSAIGTKLVHVPYKGEGPLLSDLMGGQVDSGFVSAGLAPTYVTANRVRVLAVAGPKRSILLPQTPTFAEAGYPGFETIGWSAIFLPGGTRTDIVDKVSAEVNRIIALPNVRKGLLDLGFEPKGTTPQELATIMREDLARWVALVKRFDIHLD